MAMEDTKKVLYTKEGYQALLDELDNLKNVKVQENKARLAEARSFGDLSENSEYDEARDEQAKIYARIAELEEALHHAVIHDESDVDEGLVSLGSIVTVHDYTYDEDVEYRIVGSNEADPLEGKISDLSPIGAAIVGHSEGDEVTFETPKGESKLKILSVKKAAK
jgi:transcription elongation factor GreA